MKRRKAEIIELNGKRVEVWQRHDPYLQGPQTTTVVSEFPTGDNTTKFDQGDF